MNFRGAIHMDQCISEEITTPFQENIGAKTKLIILFKNVQLVKCELLSKFGFQRKSVAVSTHYFLPAVSSACLYLQSELVQK